VSFEPVTRITGVAAPLLRANVDTDVIIRIDRLTTNRPSELAPYAFEALRYRADGSEEPSFILNRAPFRGAPILVAGPNFGCGSSREPAVWALMGLGIRCVIAPSFGDIFQGNCFQNGVLPVELPEADVDALAVAAESGEPVTVDLREQRVTTSSRSWSFALPALRKQSLLEGLDDLDLALQDLPLVLAWEERDRQARPWAWLTSEAER
jgi:3-isopropylmalate/(R)-2-methylmalate dehydratase small subunit